MQTSTVGEQITDFIVARFPLARKRGVKRDDQLLENGILDSLGVLELVTYLEETFEIAVADEDLMPENFQTIERLTAFVQEKAENKAA